MKCTMTKASRRTGVPLPKLSKTAHASLLGFNLQDNGDLTWTLQGIDAAGNVGALDPTLVTLTAVSDTPAVVTEDAPVGVTGAVHVPVPAPAIGATANITIVATWTAGGTGPFTVVWPQTIIS